MERSEPSLVPEWLRSTGSISGGIQRIGGDKSSHRGSFLDRTLSGNFRHSSSNKSSSKHPYSSFNRNPRDRNRDKVKEKCLTRDLLELDNFDPLGDILISRSEKDTLRSSRLLLCKKPCESLPRKAADVKTKTFGNNTYSSSNGVPPGGIHDSGVHRAAFDKDFPSLGIEEKHRGGDGRRVPSPGAITVTQSLIGGEGWTSALVEVPAVTGSNLKPISVQQVVPLNASSSLTSPLAGPNMAETLSQGPLRACTPSELPDKEQMLAELAKKQSKQLIPMTPSMPKGLVHKSDKFKFNASLRTGEHVVATKSAQQHQQHSSHLANQAVRDSSVRSEVTGTRSSNGRKFIVLKPVRDNGVPGAKDVAGVSNNSSKGETNSFGDASMAANVKSLNNSKASSAEGKVSAFCLDTVPLGGKRPSFSQVQSRSDFFKLMRKKSSTSASGSSVSADRSAEVAEASGDLICSCITEDGSKVTSNGDSHEEEKNLCLERMVYSDEEEAAFLRSLGWDENAGEDDGLTEEEINAFYEEIMNMKPSLKLCRDVEQKITSLCIPPPRQAEHLLN